MALDAAKDLDIQLYDVEDTQNFPEGLVHRTSFLSSIPPTVVVVVVVVVVCVWVRVSPWCPLSTPTHALTRL